MRAVALCERLPHCAGVDVNVEGTVATLKRESELSRRTSRLRPEVAVTRVHQLHPSAAADVPCGLDDNGVAVDSVWTPAPAGGGGETTRRRFTGGGPGRVSIRLRFRG